MSHYPSNEDKPLRLGLRANWQQFTLLIVVNAFVGAMIGLERTLLPLIAEADFGLASRTVVLSFLISFGIVKAVANLFAGSLGDRWGRKRILVAGWLVGLPVPLLIMFAPSWGWIIFANVLLGINQGLCWSTAVIMKIDLVGPKQRGLAMGFNEFAGYLAVSLTALATGYVAAAYGLRPVPFYPGLFFALMGLLLSVFWVRETKPFAHLEAQSMSDDQETPPFAQVLLRTSWKDKSLFSASQAGMVNNLNDGVMWGLLPLFLAGRGLPLAQIGILAAVSDVAQPSWRGSAVGVYRLWRDSGYAVGAIVAGLLADALGIQAAIIATGGLTLLSGIIVAAFMRETLPGKGEQLSHTAAGQGQAVKACPPDQVPNTPPDRYQI
jgi:MFS family permease